MSFSNDGLVFDNYPDPTGDVGQYRPSLPVIKQVIASGLDHGTIRIADSEQCNYFYTYTTIYKTDGQKVYLALAFPTKELEANARDSLHRSLINLLLVYALVSVVVWKGSDVLILRWGKARTGISEDSIGAFSFHDGGRTGQRNGVPRISQTSDYWYGPKNLLDC